MDWSLIIAELQDKKLGNMTQQQIADSISCSQNYISDLKTKKKGKRLSYQIADGLKKLYEQKVLTAA